MADARHSPWPWVARPAHSTVWDVLDARDRDVVTVFGGRADDAYLIAAAPDLLEALHKAERFIANGVELGFIRMPDDSTPDPAHDTLPAIRAAIAKAEPRND